MGKNTSAGANFCYRYKNGDVGINRKRYAMDVIGFCVNNEREEKETTSLDDAISKAMELQNGVCFAKTGKILDEKLRTQLGITKNAKMFHFIIGIGTPLEKHGVDLVVIHWGKFATIKIVPNPSLYNLSYYVDFIIDEGLETKFENFVPRLVKFLRTRARSLGN